MGKIIKIKEESIASGIHFIRGEKVMLDFDLAALYGVQTRTLKQSVKRHKRRFPFDFMFELTENEINQMVSQFVIPSKSYFGGAKPMAFTEQGIAMLSGILSSSRAIEVNIAIMRTFVQMRTWMLENKELAKKIAELEKKYDGNFAQVFRVLNQLIAEPSPKKVRLGFQVPEKN
jgi:hypothetical protein